MLQVMRRQRVRYVETQRSLREAAFLRPSTNVIREDIVTKQIGVVLTVALLSGSTAWGSRGAAGTVGGFQSATRQEFQSIQFERGSARLPDRHAQLMRSVLAWLAKNADGVIVIGGHAWEEGGDVDPRVLSQQRAEAVRAYFRAQGIALNRLRVISYGEERPLCTKSSESCWRLNRRAEIRVTGGATEPDPNGK